ncbi:MAG TPA: hypothetical protein VFS52_09180 [Steroidobacteraceae bacterium]|jgi:hypothetical protein|nr:hypothetical protein [Steroidobacteraceae bacterium]
MNANDTQASDFEQRASALLGESVTRVNGRVRSRLNQARQAAVAEIAAGRQRTWRGPLLLQASGLVAAAVLVALLVSAHYRAERAFPSAPLDDIEMLADTEGLDLLENDGSFYEWAAGQAEALNTDGTSG